MAYRSDLQAAEARKAVLESKLAEVRAWRLAAERNLPTLRGSYTTGEIAPAFAAPDPPPAQTPKPPR